jgi:hypothetical protein
MQVKEAALLAKQYVKDLLEEERIQNVGLEEIGYEGTTGTWYVTVGFSRPWDREQPPPPASITEIMGKLLRDMKIVAIDDTNGNVISVKNRE